MRRCGRRWCVRSCASVMPALPDLGRSVGDRPAGCRDLRGSAGERAFAPQLWPVGLALPTHPVAGHRDAGRGVPGLGRPCRASAAAGHDRAARSDRSDRALAAGLAFRSVQDPRRGAGRRAGRGSPGWSGTSRSAGGRGVPRSARTSAVQPSGHCASLRSCRARSGGAGRKASGCSGEIREVQRRGRALQMAFEDDVREVERIAARAHGMSTETADGAEVVREEAAQSLAQRVGTGFGRVNLP